MRVAVIGPPSSGNNFILFTLSRCGASCDVLHADVVHRAASYDKAVVMVRGIFTWDASCRRRKLYTNGPKHFGAAAYIEGQPAHELCYRTVFEVLGQLKLPFVVMSYEAATGPDAYHTLELLTRWLGLPWKRWPENSATERPFDANARYRLPPPTPSGT